MPAVGFTRVEQSGFVNTIYVSLLRNYFYLPIAQEPLRAVVMLRTKSLSQSNQHYSLVITWLGDLISVNAGDEVVGGGWGGNMGQVRCRGKLLDGTESITKYAASVKKCGRTAPLRHHYATVLYSLFFPLFRIQGFSSDPDRNLPLQPFRHAVAKHKILLAYLEPENCYHNQILL